jgi:hypothetical protein
MTGTANEPSQPATSSSCSASMPTASSRRASRCHATIAFGRSAERDPAPGSAVRTT